MKTNKKTKNVFIKIANKSKKERTTSVDTNSNPADMIVNQVSSTHLPIISFTNTKKFSFQRLHLLCNLCHSAKDSLDLITPCDCEFTVHNECILEALINKAQTACNICGRNYFKKTYMLKKLAITQVLLLLLKVILTWVLLSSIVSFGILLGLYFAIENSIDSSHNNQKLIKIIFLLLLGIINLLVLIYFIYRRREEFYKYTTQKILICDINDCMI